MVGGRVGVMVTVDKLVLIDDQASRGTSFGVGISAPLFEGLVDIREMLFQKQLYRIIRSAY